MRVPIIENVLKANDELAALNRRRLGSAGVYTINIIGAPGSGKTSLLEASLEALSDLRLGVIAGDLATQRDADRLSIHAAQVVQVNTGRGCHLEANHIHEALAQIDVEALDILFIENVGNLVCPVGFDLGQDAKVGVFSVAGGDDKAAKHPHLVVTADLIVVTMLDLLPFVSFDPASFTADVRSLNASVPICQLSAKDGHGMPGWLNWIRSRRESSVLTRSAGDLKPVSGVAFHSTPIR